MEKYELVDISGNKTGKILTYDGSGNRNNIPKGYYMSVVGVIVINNNNEILLQKRSKSKKVNPSKWGICGGKVEIGETTLEAGIRETLEEIGILLNKEDLNFLNMNISDNVHFTVYYVRKDIDANKCKLQAEEVEKIKYFNIEELKNLDNEGFEWLEKLREVIEV